MRLRTLLLSLLLCASVQAADVTLAWDDNQQGVTFDVWRDVAGGWRKVNRKPITEREYTVNAQPGTHRYAVTAVNEIGESERSNTLALRVDVTVLEN